jgi:hypothetical protein
MRNQDFFLCGLCDFSNMLNVMPANIFEFPVPTKISVITVSSTHKDISDYNFQYPQRYQWLQFPVPTKISVITVSSTHKDISDYNFQYPQRYQWLQFPVPTNISVITVSSTHKDISDYNFQYPQRYQWLQFPVPTKISVITVSSTHKDISDYSFGFWLLSACDCYPPGTFENEEKVMQCALNNGQCHCKPNVEGTTCDVCAQGYFNLDSGNGKDIIIKCDPLWQNEKIFFSDYITPWVGSNILEASITE